MGKEVLTRRPEPNDVPGIYRVMRESRREAFDELLPPDALDWDADVSEEFRDFIHNRLAHEKMALLVAISRETIVGVIELVWLPEETQSFVAPSEAELPAIHVRPEYWNEGVGTQLLKEAITLPPSRLSGIAPSVLADNERARTFYERRGFVQDGTTTTTFASEERTEAVYRHTL
ncbi:GNAT family N-acetyltransferase [Halovivax gelatinilyticus]|uniref:GNAT family N-acetyltransferase n=1 Tax=Halovivax gelatinilyticus TaxID=2961597 RepID=UPI0020CA35BE|nr:GNAT family N-acetyltransferase [Halovivax gelatinilyticus]